MTHPAVRTALLLALLLLGAPLALQAQVDEQLVRSYLWPQTPGEFGPAEAGLRAAPWTVLVPSFALTITVLAFNFLGDGLRDAFDPRLRGE